MDTQISYKKTNNFTYIHGSSFHPQSTYKSIARGEALRILRNCSDKPHFDAHLANLVRHLRDRKFPRSAIKLAKGTRFADRSLHLEGRTKDDDDRPRLFLTHIHAQYRPSIQHALNKNWLAIDSDPVLSRKIGHPPMLSTTNYKPLRRILNNVRLSNIQCNPTTPLPASVFQHLPLSPPARQDNFCGSTRCKVCPRLTALHCIRNNRNKLAYNIDTNLTCKTTGIIYALHCNLCGRMYVGQTGYDMRHRLAGHTYAFPRIKKTLYLHFIDRHKIHTLDVKITLLERQTEQDSRLRGEVRWIEALDTYLPRGLNTIAPLHQY